MRIVAVAALLAAAPVALADGPALTIYNQNFAVVRETLPLDLKAGVNEVSYSGTTAHVEPDSVILRDPSGRHVLRILEQNYRAEPVSQELLLSLYEGQTIDFQVVRSDRTDIVAGKVIRSGIRSHRRDWDVYGDVYYQTQRSRSEGSAGQPIIEVNGKLMFGLPGQPLFPALSDQSILKPMVIWKLETDRDGAFDGELAYITNGMRWEATYNAIAPEEGDTLEMLGWVTIGNDSGKSFENARVKLMAGDVKKLTREDLRAGAGDILGFSWPEQAAAPAVAEKTFDEHHLYTLSAPTTLHDGAVKQVEFVRAAGVTSSRFYVYDGVKIDTGRYDGWTMENIRREENYGTEWNPHVWVMREFANSEANGLGVPLPQGRTRFYRRDGDGQIEFTGENLITHTPKDEKVRFYTGNAFDLVGERRRIAFSRDTTQDRWVRETFEITLRNHKQEAAEVRVVEHLYRWYNWNISGNSDAFEKRDGQTVEFRVTLQPDEERVVRYTVHYSW